MATFPSRTNPISSTAEENHLRDARSEHWHRVRDLTFDEAQEFESIPEFVALKKRNLDVYLQLFWISSHSMAYHERIDAALSRSYEALKRMQVAEKELGRPMCTYSSTYYYTREEMILRTVFAYCRYIRYGHKIQLDSCVVDMCHTRGHAYRLELAAKHFANIPGLKDAEDHRYIATLQWKAKEIRQNTNFNLYEIVDTVAMKMFSL